MFKLDASERLSRWKHFRDDINQLELSEALQLVSVFWQKCPFTPFYLDIKDVKSWPDPWQLIYENYYCDLAKVLGMLYTLHLSNHKNFIYPELRIYTNTKTRHTYHIAYLCDGKYVLNLIEGEVVNKEHINQELKLKYRYTAADLKLEQY